MSGADQQLSLFSIEWTGADREETSPAPGGGGLAEVSPVHVADGSNGATCLACGLAFPSLVEQRHHFASESHAEVLRGSKGQDASSSASESSEDEGESAPAEGTPFLGLETAGGDVLLVWKSLFPSVDLRRLRRGSVCRDPAVLSRARELSGGDRPWIIALLRSGHFAAGVWRRGELIAHKTIQRYTTRRKQGGSQAKRDSSAGSQVHSAGSSIRRYGERMLREEMVELFSATWREHVAAAAVLLVGTSKGTWTDLVGDGAPFSKADPRVCRVPLVFGRPNHTEMRRVFAAMASARRPAPEGPARPARASASAGARGDAHVDAAGDAHRAGAGTGAGPSAPAAAAPDAPPLPAEAVAFVRAFAAACTAGDDFGASAAVEAAATESWLPAALSSVAEGGPLLHLACRAGLPSAARALLEAGADPTVRAAGRTACAVASSKAVKLAFRRFRGAHPARWDYAAAGVGEPVAEGSADDETARRRERNRKKRERQRAARRQQRDQRDSAHAAALRQAEAAEAAAEDAAAEGAATATAAAAAAPTDVQVALELEHLAAELGMEAGDLVARVLSQGGDVATAVSSLREAHEAGMTATELLELLEA